MSIKWCPLLMHSLTRLPLTIDHNRKTLARRLCLEHGLPKLQNYKKQISGVYKLLNPRCSAIAANNEGLLRRPGKAAGATTNRHSSTTTNTETFFGTGFKGNIAFYLLIL